MNRRIVMGILVLAIVEGLALGCQPEISDTSTPAEPATPRPTSSPTRSPNPSGPVVPAEAEKAVQLARADLARRLAVKAETIAVASVQAMDWPSTALGCPQPGVMYAQIITPGYRVILVAGDKRYKYHTDRGSNAVLC